jgi:uncharacterized protein
MWVYPWSKKISDIRQECISFEYFSELEENLKRYIYSDSAPKESLIPLRSLCKATCSDSFLIDPMGRLLKCWVEFGQDEVDEFVVGDIFCGINQEKYNRKWFNYNPINLKITCKNCVYFPLCLGGCPFILINQNELSDINCKYWDRKVYNFIEQEFRRYRFADK